jgi:hypothetical protein
MNICSQCRKEHEGPFKHCDKCRAYHKEWKHAHAAQLAADARLYRTKHPDKVKEAKLKYHMSEKGRRNDHDRNLQHDYGITLAYKEQMYAEQQGLCALCKKSLPPVIQSCYEHSHETGKGRGLVHKQCNNFIGIAERMPGAAENITTYLKLATTKEVSSNEFRVALEDYKLS